MLNYLKLYDDCRCDFIILSCAKSILPQSSSKPHLSTYSCSITNAVLGRAKMIKNVILPNGHQCLILRHNNKGSE